MAVAKIPYPLGKIFKVGDTISMNHCDGKVTVDFKAKIVRLETDGMTVEIDDKIVSRINDLSKLGFTGGTSSNISPGDLPKRG